MLSNNITIPPEAFTAAELAYTEALSNGEDPIRAACLAMLKAWPGAAENSSRLGEKLFVLPLSENPNDKG